MDLVVELAVEFVVDEGRVKERGAGASMIGVSSGTGGISADIVDWYYFGRVSGIRSVL